MRVLHLLSSNKFSGAENVVCQIIDMFKNEVEMFYCSPDGLISNTLKNKGIKFLPLKKLNKKELLRVVKMNKIDVIHAHDVKASILASKVHGKYRIISHIHGNDKRKMGKITLKSLFYNYVSKNFDSIIMVSNSCFNDYVFKNKIENKTIILHNIINIKSLKNLLNLDENEYCFDICYLGRLSEIKNPLRMLNIIKNVVVKKPEIKCAIIGDGELKKDCENFVKINNLENNIQFFGFLSNPYKILKDSRLMIMSSINEGTPMAVLEAFALGVPLVSTKVDGASELINNELMGNLYSTNEQAVSQILKILNNNKEEYEKYLLKFSKDYNNIEEYKKKLLNIWEH